MPLDLDALRQNVKTRWNTGGTYDDVCKALAELTEARRTLQWQPIETAPKDGTLFLVWCPAAHGLPSMFSLCAWHQDAGFCVDELRDPTHWRPLPAQPTPPAFDAVMKLFKDWAVRVMLPSQFSHNDGLRFEKMARERFGQPPTEAR